MDLRKIFREIGFTDYETRILIYLNGVDGTKNAKQIAEGADVPLTKLYSLLLGLEEDGLIEKLPGEVNLYRLVEREELINTLREMKEEEIREREDKLDSLMENLDSSLDRTTGREVSISYFTSNKKYWKAYNREVSKLGMGDVYRIINNNRWALSFLPEEIEDRPGLESMIRNDINQRLNKNFILYHMVNPESFVESILEDLGERERIKKSLAQLLFYYGHEEMKKTHYIELAPEFKNILIAIINTSTFIEFYSGGRHDKISNAIQIKSREVSEDFANWFDGYCSGTKDPDEDFKRFKEEVLRCAEELKDIEPREIEDEIENVDPVYLP